MMDGRNSVSSTQLVRDLPSVKQRLSDGPVFVTSHGRDEFVIIDKAELGRLSKLVDVDAKRLDGKLSIVLDAVDTLVLLFDDELKVRRANRAFCDFFDRDPDALIGTSINDLLVTPTDQYLAHRIRSVLESGTAERFELPSAHRAGRFFLHLITPWPNGVAFFASDVTDKTRLRDLELSQSALDVAMKSLVGVGVALLDSTGKIIEAKPNLEALLNTSASTIEGTSILSILDTKDRSRVEDLLVFSDEPVRTETVRYLHRGGDLHRARIAISPYQISHNQLLFAAVIQDLDLLM